MKYGLRSDDLCLLLNEIKVDINKQIQRHCGEVCSNDTGSAAFVSVDREKGCMGNTEGATVKYLLKNLEASD